MPNEFQRKFSDPRWKAKEREVLERAGFECEYCQVDEGLEVHICFFEPGRDPWEYSDDLYKCYCSEHRSMRRGVEADIRRIMASFGPDELDSLHLALQQLACVPESDRSLAVERFYIKAKKVRYETDI